METNCNFLSVNSLQPVFMMPCLASAIHQRLHSFTCVLSHQYCLALSLLKAVYQCCSHAVIAILSWSLTVTGGPLVWDVLQDSIRGSPLSMTPWLYNNAEGLEAVVCVMESQPHHENLNFSFQTTHTVSGPALSTTCMLSSNLSSTPLLTELLSVSTSLSSINHYQQNQAYQIGHEDAHTSTFFVNKPLRSLHDDHGDPYVPSERDGESEDSEQASQISNLEVCSSNIIFC